MDPITAIASLLSVCGINSMRNFTPMFIFGVAARFLPQWSRCPEPFAAIAEKCPDWLTCDFGLCVFGVLAAMETVANWNDTLRALMEDVNWDLYAKPVFALAATFALFSPEQAQVLSQATGTVLPPSEAPALVDYVLPTALAIGGAACTGGLAWIRQSIAEGLRTIDPENNFGFHWVAAGIEECLWAVILMAALVLPMAALVLVLVSAAVTWIFGKTLVRLAERRRRHWEGRSRAEIVKTLDLRTAILVGAGFLSSGVPCVGFLMTVLLLNVLVFGVLRLYEKTWEHLVQKIVFRVVKISFFLLMLLFSGIPFAGAAFLLPYLVSYWVRRQRFLRGEQTVGSCPMSQ